MSKSYRITMTGDRKLDRKLRAIAESEGSKSINAQMRKSTRYAIRHIVMPVIMARVPFETGLLERSLTVKAIKRSRSKLGSAAGFRDDLFKGDTFYAGFLEYGWMNRGGTAVPGDSFLRGPLYENESKIKASVTSDMRSWVRARNK